jgi:hypothetical protein
MELEDFISESIKQICFGIRKAQKEVSDKIGNNCPITPRTKFNGKGDVGYEEKENITFDIAITVTDDNKLNASGAIGIRSLGFGAKGETSKKEENIHRISFSIPFYPSLLNDLYKSNN